MGLAFGIAAHAASRATTAAFTSFAGELSRHVGFEVSPVFTGSYDELTAKFAQGDVALAWLPPIPFIALEQRRLAIPLVGHHRAGRAEFQAVLVVRSDSKIRVPASLAGKRVAWIDPLSASGYVLPRIHLAALGIDPRTVFASEHFYGSHEAALRAVIGGKADVAGTYAKVEAEGRALEGSWSSLEGAAGALRVCMTFGSIPADLIAARSALQEKLRDSLRDSLVAITATPKGSKLVKLVFGADDLRPWIATNYDPLRRAMADAASRGLLDAIQTLEANAQ